MHALSMLALALTGPVVCRTEPLNSDTRSMVIETKGIALMQQQHWHVTGASLQSQEATKRAKARSYVPRSFVGGRATVAGSQPCTEDHYQPSHVEGQWTQNALKWTDNAHCSHMTSDVAKAWIQENQEGSFDPLLFSTICRKGQQPQYIEPLAALLRDPRFNCPEVESPINSFLMSVDWLVFPDPPVIPAGFKARFYDAGGSHFNEALQFFVTTYQSHGVIFDEVYVWEMQQQGVESYWRDVDGATRAFWEPRVRFYDGIGVTTEVGAEHNPVSRIFSNCAPEDFCAFKLDIDTPQVEMPLVQQLLGSPNLTKSKLDEFYFEHHVEGPLKPWWGVNVVGTYADSYEIFGSLRKLGVRAHSWV